MVEVTRRNFSDTFPKVKYAIQAADFIAIDTEFTGLYYDNNCKPSLFDDSKQRYSKLKASVQKFSLCQIGITTFKGNVSENRYQVETFNFHLCPVSIGSCDHRFALQASSVRFMVKHNFNFNKWLYEGIPFLNESEEQQLSDDLESGLPFDSIDSHVDEDKLQSLCSFVASWLSNKAAGDCVILPLEKDESHLASSVYQTDLRKRFSQIWTTVDPFGQVVVKRIDPAEREKLELQVQGSNNEQRENQLQEMLGFTRVFRLLVGLKTPIIGHNLLMDLMFMFEKFHQPLPDLYSKFKKDIHKLFPNIYDTKHICYCLRMENLQLSSVRNLKDLYDILHSPSFIGLALLQPTIERVERCEHETFLRICHLLHFRKIKSANVQPCPFQAYLVTMRNYLNCVNVIRAMVNHIKFGGEDPPSQRPPLIHVEAAQPGDKLLAQQLAAWFSMYGTVDIQMISSKQAVVATANFMTARDIIYNFKDHKLINVTKYRFWEHSQLGQRIILGSFVAATGSCILLLIHAFK